MVSPLEKAEIIVKVEDERMQLVGCRRTRHVPVLLA